MLLFSSPAPTKYLKSKDVIELEVFGDLGEFELFFVFLGLDGVVFVIAENKSGQQDESFVFPKSSDIR